MNRLRELAVRGWYVFLGLVVLAHFARPTVGGLLWVAGIVTLVAVGFVFRRAVRHPGGRADRAVVRVFGGLYRRWPWRRPTRTERCRQQARWN